MKQKLPTIITITVCAVIMLAVILICFGAFGNVMQQILGSLEGLIPESSQSSGLYIDPDAQDLADKVDLQGSKESIAIPGYDVIAMSAGKEKQRVVFFNPEGNGCYFQISLTLSDGTPLYESGLIPPGKAVYGITLRQALEAGTYEDAVLAYSCYALGDMAELNGAVTVLKLEVQ